MFSFSFPFLKATLSESSFIWAPQSPQTAFPTSVPPALQAVPEGFPSWASHLFVFCLRATWATDNLCPASMQARVLCLLSTALLTSSAFSLRWLTSFRVLQSVWWSLTSPACPTQQQNTALCFLILTSFVLKWTLPPVWRPSALQTYRPLAACCCCVNVSVVEVSSFSSDVDSRTWAGSFNKHFGK